MSSSAYIPLSEVAERKRKRMERELHEERVNLAPATQRRASRVPERLVDKITPAQAPLQLFPLDEAKRLFGRQHVRVAPSNIPNAGRGLFVTEDHAKGERIALYYGRIEPKPDTADNGYLLDIGNEGGAEMVLNGHPDVLRELRIASPETETPASFANDARNAEKNNAHLATYTRRSDGRVSAYIEATREIKAGEEVYVDYGNTYWNHAAE